MSGRSYYNTHSKKVNKYIIPLSDRHKDLISFKLCVLSQYYKMILGYLINI